MTQIDRGQVRIEPTAVARASQGRLAALIAASAADERGVAVSAYLRSGSITYSLYPPAPRKYLVDSRGELEFRQFEEFGSEGVQLSQAVLYEEVESLRIPFAEWDHPDGGRRVFVGDNTMPAQAQGCVLVGGQRSSDAGSMTKAVADLRVSSGNEVTFGSQTSGQEFYLFVLGPMKVFRDDYRPEAARVFGKVRCAATLVADNKLLFDIALPQEEGTISGFAIEHELRKMYPDISFRDKTVRFQLYHQALASSEGAGAARVKLMGVKTGFAALAMKRK